MKSWSAGERAELPAVQCVLDVSESTETRSLEACVRERFTP